MKKLARILVIIAIWAAVTWVFREKLLPIPKPDDRPPPHFRSDPPGTPTGTLAGTDAPQDNESVANDDDGAPSGDDLTEVRGIGPVYRHRLGEIGITTFVGLAECDVAQVAARIDVPESLVTDWVEQARQRSA